MALHDLGVAVRQLRENTEPAEVGLKVDVPPGGRRVRGLRREELAELARVSADCALRVGTAEYERLCALAGYAAADGQVPREAGAASTRLLERFADTPMFLCDPAWNVVALNGAWMALQAGAPTGHLWDWNVISPEQ